MKVVDQFDIAILRHLQRDNKMPQRLIAEAVRLSPPAVQRRIRKLEQDGVIEANVAVIKPSAIGQGMTVLVEVSLLNEGPEMLASARRAFVAAEEVQQCYYVTGETDFMLIVTVAGMAHYEALTQRLFLTNPNVKRFRTLIVMDRVKVGLSVPLPEG